MDFNFRPVQSDKASSLALHQILDPQHRNVVASVFKYPSTWQAQSQMAWNLQDINLPVKAHALTYNPQGAECVEFFPAEMFFWLAEGVYFYKQGQSVMGYAFMLPMSALDALKNLVVPKFRGNLPGLRLVRGGNVPILSRLGSQQQSARGEEACVTLDYSFNGRPMEEEIYGVRVQQDIPYYGPQGMMLQVNWGFHSLFSFRAEKGQLDAKRELFWQIAASLKVNAPWGELLTQIMKQLQEQFNQALAIGYSQIEAAGQISRTISTNNDAMLAGFAHQRESEHRSYIAHRREEATESGRTTHDDFSDMMRGVETVHDPYWGESQQDANYTYHWTDGQGNYQHSDDPFFNPSIGATQNWTLMQPKQR